MGLVFETDQGQEDVPVDFADAVVTDADPYAACSPAIATQASAPSQVECVLDPLMFLPGKIQVRLDRQTGLPISAR